MKEITISENEANQRIDRFLQKYMSLASKGFLEKMIRKKRIKVNNQRIDPNYQLKINDSIQMYLSQETIEKFQSLKVIKPTDKSISILFEDTDILLVNKDKNVLVHGEDDSLIDRAVQYLIKKGEYDPLDEITFTPACCNRLDRNTSGIVIIAKTYSGLRRINYKIKENSIKKYYKVLIKGIIEKSELLVGYLKKDNETNTVKALDQYQKGAKEIQTGIEPLEYFNGFTLVEIDLITGRSHQIRAHLKHIGHAVVGDPKYGDPCINAIFKEKFSLQSQFLHAARIVIENYNGSDLEIHAPLPLELQQIIDEINIHGVD